MLFLLIFTAVACVDVVDAVVIVIVDFATDNYVTDDIVVVVDATVAVVGTAVDVVGVTTCTVVVVLVVGL